MHFVVQNPVCDEKNYHEPGFVLG